MKTARYRSATSAANSIQCDQQSDRIAHLVEPMAPGREEQRWIRQGADAEFKRLEPRNNKLREAVKARDKSIAALQKDLRALQLQVTTAKGASLDDGTLASLEASARADADLMAELRAQTLQDAGKINELCAQVNRQEKERQDWMRWAWAGQPQSEDSDDAVYQVKITMLERAVAYWSSRARNEYPANSQAVADSDVAIDFSSRHLRLDDILRLMEKM